MRSSSLLAMLACCLLATFCARAAELPSRPYPGGVQADIWLLAGQSNMFGSASMPDKLEPPDPRIKLFNMDNTWIEAQDPLHRIFEAEAPIIRWFRYNDNVTTEQYMKMRAESKIKPIGGVGPGMPFARTVVAGINRPLGLIPNSPGGSNMAHWDPALRDKHGDSLYGAMMDRVQMVGGKVKGLLWYQGEGETMEDSVDGYESALEKLFTSVRRDLGQPDLPILMVQISRWTKQNDPELDRKWEHVRDVQYRVAQRMPNVYVVTTVDLSLTDEIHIDYPAQQRLGKRLGEIALSKVYGVAGHGTPIALESVNVTKANERWPVIRVKFSGVTGKLGAPGLPSGFQVRFPQATGRLPQIFRIDFDPADPSVVILKLGAAIKADSIKGPVQLIYGAGSNPYTNIVDERDMPIPAFGPIELKLD